jgi:hypothetical protein
MHLHITVTVVLEREREKHREKREIEKQAEKPAGRDPARIGRHCWPGELSTRKRKEKI